MSDYHSGGSYRLRAGWVSRAELPAEYEIVRWPKAADQRYTRWKIPMDEGRLTNRYAEDVISLGGAAITLGEGNDLWPLGGWTTGMTTYVKDTIFSGLNWGKFTIMTWDRSVGWIVVQCYGYLKRPAEAGTPGWRRGFKSYKIEWVIVADAPAGPDLAITMTHPAPVAVNVNKAYTITVNNIGSATYGDVVVSADVLASFTFVTFAGTGWTREYFESGVWVSTVTTPANVTKVRATLDASLAAGATATTLTLTMMPTLTDTYDVSASVTTPGDVSVGNNAAIDVTVVV